VKGTVSRNGKPVSGVLVTVHKSKSSYYTSFDGKYEVKTDPKSLWICFTLAGIATKIALDPHSDGYLNVVLTADNKVSQTTSPESADSLKNKRIKK